MKRDDAAEDGVVRSNAILQRLCGYLIARHRHSTEEEAGPFLSRGFLFNLSLRQAHSIAQSVLAIVGSIWQVADEGVAVIREDTWLVPSLVSFLMRYSKPVFEEDISLEHATEGNQLR